jgi:uncharacterized membrane protein
MGGEIIYFIKLTFMTENQNSDFNNQVQQPLPNATAVLVLGIISIALCWLFLGIPSVACGIIAIVLGNKGMAQYKANSGAFTNTSFNNLKAGRVCGIIGLCLSAIVLLLVILAFAGMLGNVEYFNRYRSY